MTNDARDLEVRELLAENEVLSQLLFNARVEIDQLRLKVDELEVEVTSWQSIS